MKLKFVLCPARMAVAALFTCVAVSHAQESLTWEQAKAKFESANPALKADALNVDETRAEELTAFLRPNPQVTVAADGTQIVSHDGVWQPFKGTDVVPTLSYLHERAHKRELRLESAKEGTKIATSQHEDLKRTLEFTLRSAFVNTLEAKAVLDFARADLEYYDHIIEISRDRFQAGDIARIDLDRIELMRVQYLTEIQTATVNLRTAKIQMLQLLDDRTAVEHFDVTGPFEFSDTLKPLDDFRQTALDSRPDLRASMQTIEQSQTNHKLAIANGSTDPTFSGWYTWNASNNNPNATQTVGASVNIPLRLFDRNQGEKQRTLIDISRSQQASEAAHTQVFGDVDSAYAVVQSDLELLKPYKDKYKDQATRVRDTITYSYQHGGASLIDFLNAQSDYRAVQQAYLQLVGSYLAAVAQLNLAVGREVIP